MECSALTNDLLLAPNTEAQGHLRDCTGCRERQEAVQLAVRALRALASEDAGLPAPNDRAIRNAIPGLAATASRRRPAGWWSFAAAAALLVAATIAGLQFRGVPARAPGAAPGAGGIMTATEEPRAAESAKAHPVDPEPARPQAPLEVPPTIPTPADPVRPPADPPPSVLPESTGTAVADVRPPTDPVRPPPDPVQPPPPDPLPALSPPATTFDASVIMRAVVERKPTLFGDLNGDGRCDVADAMLAARADAERRRQ